MEPLIREALRINERYLEEVVEALTLCPWAREARKGGSVERRVLLDRELGDQALSAALASVEATGRSSSIDIGLLIFPLLDVDRASFRRFVARLETAHGDAHPRGRAPLAMAAFHPDAEPEMSPARLVPFLRRSPDPTIQLVRHSALHAARHTSDEGSNFASGLAALAPLTGAQPKVSVSEAIARANLRTIERIGSDRVETILAAIRDDRNRAYRAVAEDAPIRR